MDFLNIFKTEYSHKLPVNFRLIRPVYESQTELEFEKKGLGLHFERPSIFHQTNCYEVKDFYKPATSLL